MSEGPGGRKRLAIVGLVLVLCWWLPGSPLEAGGELSPDVRAWFQVPLGVHLARLGLAILTCLGLRWLLDVGGDAAN